MLLLLYLININGVGFKPSSANNNDDDLVFAAIILFCVLLLLLLLCSELPFGSFQESLLTGAQGIMFSTRNWTWAGYVEARAYLPHSPTLFCIFFSFLHMLLLISIQNHILLTTILVIVWKYLINSIESNKMNWVYFGINGFLYGSWSKRICVWGCSGWKFLS